MSRISSSATVAPRNQGRAIVVGLVQGDGEDTLAVDDPSEPVGCRGRTQRFEKARGDLSLDQRHGRSGTPELLGDER